MRCRALSCVKQYNYSLKPRTLKNVSYERIESIMLECECYNCKNRSIGCHKFCSKYRIYRQRLEARQKQEKKNEEEYRATISTLTKGNVKRK